MYIVIYLYREFIFDSCLGNEFKGLVVIELDACCSKSITMYLQAF